MKVSFRATFAGPTGPLETAGFRFADTVPLEVEIFDISGKWYARFVNSRKPTRDTAISQLDAQPTHGCMKDSVGACFKRQLSKWQMCWAADGKPIDPDSVEETPEGKFSPRAVTHVANVTQEGAAQKLGTANYYKAVCGEDYVHVGLIKSLRGQDAPTCAFCRKYWQENRVHPK